jgi:hypothetical protein
LYVGGGAKLKQAPNLFVFNDSTLSLGIGTAVTGYYHLAIKIYDQSYRGTSVQAHATQIANLSDWLDSSGTIMSNVSKFGYFGVGVSSAGAPFHGVNQFSPIFYGVISNAATKCSTDCSFIADHYFWKYG